jgi:hypothetical protein
MIDTDTQRAYWQNGGTNSAGKVTHDCKYVSRSKCIEAVTSPICQTLNETRGQPCRNDKNYLKN